MDGLARLLPFFPQIWSWQGVTGLATMVMTSDKGIDIL